MTNTPPPNLNFATHPGASGTPPMTASPQTNGAIRLPGTPQMHPQQGIRMSSPAPNYFGSSTNSTPAVTPIATNVNPAMGYGMNGGGMGGMGMGMGMGMMGGTTMVPQQGHSQQAQLHQTLQPQQRPMQAQVQQQPFHTTQQQQVQSSTTPATSQAQGKDPFADLVGLF